MNAPGDTVIRSCDIFPATVAPWAAPLPITRAGEAQSLMLRAVVTERLLTIGWQFGQNIGRLDIDIEPDQAFRIGLEGGQIDTPERHWIVGRRGGCRCNANLLAGWEPFPGVNLVGATVPGSAVRDPATWGLPSPRYSRA
jgi:hypothetical protein